jgi:hypothetical protein
MPVKYLDSTGYQKIKFKAANTYVNDTNVALALSEKDIENIIVNSVHATGLDIVVTDVLGNLIPREIAFIDKINNKLELYLKDPALSTLTGGTDLYVQCGGASVAVANSLAVWDDYKIVLHGQESLANLKDSSGNFTPSDSNITYSQPGKLKNTPSFNGNNSNSNFGVLPLTGLKKLSISFWMNQNVLDIVDIIFRKLKGAMLFDLETNTDGNLYWQIAGGTNYGYFDYSTVISAGNWAFFTGVLDLDAVGNSNKMKIYVNGSPIALSFSGTIESVLPDYSGADFRIGNTSSAFDGEIDEFRFNINILSENQIKTQFINQFAFDLNSTWDISGFSSFANSYYKYW